MTGGARSSARVSRESYTGAWLSEPVDVRAFGPLDTAVPRDTLSSRHRT